MPITFARAPLVEIIAEVRWPVTSHIQVGPNGIEMNSPSSEQLYTKFSDLAAKNGYPRSERLLPPGFPIELGQVTWRFRPLDGSTLWQIGSGVFTANAVPPYKTWDEFRPQLKKGLELLLQSRSDQAKPNIVSLRYIDAFGNDLMQGLSMADFLREKFGFELNLPKPLMESKAADAALQLNTQFEFRLTNGMDLVMTAGPGSYQNEQVLMMSTGIIKKTETENSLEALMRVFEDAHTVIHKSFIDMTKSIHDRMQPQGVE